MRITGVHLLIFLAVVVLLFGSSRLPTLAKSVGQSMRIFKKEVQELQADGQEDKPVQPGPAA